MLKREAMNDIDGIERIRLGDLMKLQRDRRAEQVAYFRDAARLNKDLIDAILEYKTAKNQQSLLGYVQGR